MGAGYCFADPNKKGSRPTIILPRIDVTTLTDTQKVKWSALLGHEIGHHLYSDSKSTKEAGKHSQFVKDLHNCLEDARTEIKKEKTSIGVAEDIVKYRFVALEEMNEQPHMAELNRWGTLFQAFKYYLPNYGSVKLTEDLVPYFKEGLEILNRNDQWNKACKKDQEGCMDLLHIAIEMHDKWQEMRTEEGKNDSEQNTEENKRENELSKKKDLQSEEKSSSEKNNGRKNSKDSDSADDKGSTGSQHISDDCDDVRKEETDDRKNPKDSDEPSCGRRDDRKNPKDSNSTDDEETNKRQRNSSNSDSDSEREESLSGDEDECRLGCTDPVESRPKSIQEEYNKNQGDDESHMETDNLGTEIAALAGDDVNEKINPDWTTNESSEALDNLLRNTPKGKGQVYIPFASKDREIYPHPEPEEFQRIHNDISGRAEQISRELRRILISRSQTRVARGLRQGKIDKRLLYKIARGSNRVHYKMTPGIDTDAAVSLLIDLSGSMSGSKAKLAVRVATLFAESLDPIPKTSFEALGYNSSPLTAQDELKARNGGYTRYELINYWIFKTFEEHWTTVRNRLGACEYSFNDIYPERKGACGGCNVDHENVLHAARRLWNRPEKNKTLIVFCDGAPSGYNHTYGGILNIKLKEAVQKIRKAGIKIFCFGINSPEVEQYYSPDFCLIYKLDDLDEKALKKLGQYLLN